MIIDVLKIKLKFIIYSYLKSVNLEKGVKIYGKVDIINGKNITVGKFTTLNEGVFLNARDKIIIGNYCRISPYSQLHTGALNLVEDFKKRTHYSKPIILKDGVWLCAGVIVNPGVTIGEGSVIAPGSVLNKDVPPYELWGGVPAKKIRSICNS